MLDESRQPREPFVLDDRSLARRLDEFRAYCQQIPFVGSGANVDEPANWAQVLLGKIAGRSDSAHSDEAAFAWAFVQAQLVRLYESPERAEGALPPEQAFVLVVQGLLETPRALLNAFPDRYRDLYYRDLLGMTERPAQSDTVVVKFTLDRTVRELGLPAGQLLDAGQDGAGTSMRYALSRPLMLNHAWVTGLRWVVKNGRRPGGCRSRIVCDERSGLAWPAGGVRLFAPAAVLPAGTAPPTRDCDVVTGRVVGSDMFAIAGGQRSWTLTFTAPLPLFKAEISIADGWVTLHVKPADQTQLPGTSTWTVTLDAQGGQPAPMAVASGGTATTPQMRLTRTDGQPVPAVTQIVLDVKNATGVHCVSDSGADLTRGGLPYGKRAEVGAGVWIAAPEWWRLGSRMTSVTVLPGWRGLPKEPFAKWYGPDAAQVKSGWFVLPNTANGQPVEPKPGQVAPLPDTGYDFPAKRTNYVFKGTWSLRVPGPDAKHAANDVCPQFKEEQNGPQSLPLTFTEFDDAPKGSHGAGLSRGGKPADWPWALRFELMESFGQAEYETHQAMAPRVLQYETKTEIRTQKLKVGGNGNIEIDAQTHLPMIDSSVTTLTHTNSILVPKAVWKPPYLPQWSGLQCDYSATDTHVTDQQVITPFGLSRHDDTGAAHDLAQLYIGVDGIEAQQPLNLYWQLAQPVGLTIGWEYLDRDARWQSFSSTVRDDTKGLAQSGAWSAMWPDDAGRDTAVLPGGQFWVRARVTATSCTQQDREARLPEFGWLTDVVSHAGEAVLVAPETVEPVHFAQGLAARRITEAINAPDGLQGIEQRWPSTGGSAGETTDAFHARVARRLRHRNRVVTDTDIMLLLTEHDPQIRELLVRENGRSASPARRVKVIVMPRQGDGDDPRQPAYRSTKLNALKDWIRERASHWLEVECVNPDYVPVLVSWDAGYQPGVSDSHGAACIQAALERHFLPWLAGAMDAGTRVIGQTLTHSAVRAVIRGVPEVAAVKSVWINGTSKEYQLSAIQDKQVGIITCVPLAYQGVTVTWAGRGENRLVALKPNGNAARLDIQLPMANHVHNYSYSVELLDCDTGNVIYTDSMQGSQKWISAGVEISAPVTEKALRGYAFQVIQPPHVSDKIGIVRKIEAVISCVRSGVRTQINTARIQQTVELRIDRD
ncbi:TPA: hypothetical protein ACUNF5_002686 [Burkholderia orbicola]|nr:hypothetical protein DF039_34670 [Burkholderia cenocepacia]